MKKIVMLAIAGLCLQNSYAQINRGQILLGGTAAYTSRTVEQTAGDYTNTEIAVMPNVGYFILNKLAIGARLNATFTDNDNNNKTTTLIGAPFLRYYFLNKESKFNVLADASYGYGSFKAGDADSRSIEGYNFSAGPVIFLNPHVGLEITVNYGAQKYELNDWVNTIRAGVGLQIHLGSGAKRKSKAPGSGRYEGGEK